ncbi:nitrate- and nitrite sensing domain-containing protein [Actinomadura sp. NTSP31]|uniref:nitrate- and nitrite sensing domain-containing protein n=1 Tax=Actinomadura sp. NTSP31 TaxID=1735447 RepID=UPI0035C19ECF
MPVTEAAPAFNKSTRLHPVRYRISLLLILPLVSLVGLWAFAATLSLGSALNEIALTRVVDRITKPAGSAGVLLQQERAAAAAVLAQNTDQARQRLTSAEATTDAAISLFHTQAIPAAKKELDRTAQRLMDDLDQRYRTIGELRTKVHAGTITPADAIKEYDGLSDSTSRTFGSVVKADNAEVFHTSAALVNTYRSSDFTLREDALLTVAASRGGRMTVAEHTAFIEAAGNRRQSTEIALTSLSSAVHQRLQPLLQSPQYARYQTLENSEEIPT